MLDLPMDVLWIYAGRTYRPTLAYAGPALDLLINLSWTYAEHTFGSTLDLPQTCLPVDLRWTYDGPSSIDLSMELLVLDLNPFST